MICNLQNRVPELLAQRGRAEDDLNLATAEFHRRCAAYGRSPNDATRSELRQATAEIERCRARLQDLDNAIGMERGHMQRVMLTAAR
jgi:hypothetical protein